MPLSWYAIMENRCLAALLAALVCFVADTPHPARAADDLPPIDRPIHAQTWSGETFFTTPQLEPLQWDLLGYEPRVSGRIGAVILQRARPQSTPFIVNPFDGSPIIDPADFDFPFEGGVDAGLVWYGTWADIEVRYFGVNDWDAAQGPLFSPDGFSIPIPGFDPSPFPLYIRSWYTSSLNSVEVNLRRTVAPRWSVLAGFRWVSLDEVMAAFVGDSTFENGTIIAFETRNDLFGMQIGAEGILWQPGPRFRVETAIKAGVYADAAQGGINAKSVGGGGGDGGVWLHHDHTAFVGDLNFVGVYQISDHWALRGGYQLLWLSGVAVPSEQIHRLNFDTGNLGVNTSHGAFFHGALVGLERTW